MWGAGVFGEWTGGWGGNSRSNSGAASRPCLPTSPTPRHSRGAVADAPGGSLQLGARRRRQRLLWVHVAVRQRGRVCIGLRATTAAPLLGLDRNSAAAPAHPPRPPALPTRCSPAHSFKRLSLQQQNCSAWTWCVAAQGQRQNRALHRAALLLRTLPPLRHRHRCRRALSLPRPLLYSPSPLPAAGPTPPGARAAPRPPPTTRPICR